MVTFGMACCGLFGNQTMKQGNAIDHTGRRYGRLTVLEQCGRAKDGHVLWKCLCDCGTACIVQSNNFRGGAKRGTQSCGCLRSETNRRLKTVWNSGKTYQIHSDEQDYRSRKAWAEAVRKTRGNRCERCGWDEALCDVHHRVQRSVGGRNTISNGEVICPNCHRIEHGGGQ